MAAMKKASNGLYENVAAWRQPMKAAERRHQCQMAAIVAYLALGENNMVSMKPAMAFS
jgi:hypothetical protein